MNQQRKQEKEREFLNRFKQHEKRREQFEETADMKKIEEPKRIIQRLNLIGRSDLLEDLMTDKPFVKERILQANELLSSEFLALGARVRHSVGRISIHTPLGSGFGTGFLISPNLLMTNNHVLESETAAADSFIEFDLFSEGDGTTYSFAPNQFFITNERLDFTIVAIEPEGSGEPLGSRGWSPLIEGSGKALIGDPVNIIQHPRGRVQEVSFRMNKVVDRVGKDFLHYRTDTEPGSSGSPVYNDQWQLAALHHAGVPGKRDSKGNIIDWAANEGIRISAIVSFLKKQITSRSSSEQQLFNEAFASPPEMPALSHAGPRAAPPESRPFAYNVARQTEDGYAQWEIPLKVRVALGDTCPSPQVGATQNATAGIPASRKSKTQGRLLRKNRSAAAALAEQELENFEDKPYYDEGADQEAIETYYDSVGTRITKMTRYERLRDLIQSTHQKEIRYDTARKKFLYPWVDLHESEGAQRELKSIYSGKGFDPVEVLRQEIQMEIDAIGEDEYFALDEEEISRRLEALENDLPFNCEHVVCQSWFAKKEPMKGDLHHLFTCESRCNSFRNNHPYWDFEMAEEAFRDECGRLDDEGGETRKFEPVAGKGAVARATLYFLIRYPGKIGDEIRELQKERLGILLKWHKEFPVDLYERHRNAAIFEIQGNRNPLVDHPEWSEKIDFDLGFGG